MSTAYISFLEEERVSAPTSRALLVALLLSLLTHLMLSVYLQDQWKPGAASRSEPEVQRQIELSLRETTLPETPTKEANHGNREAVEKLDSEKPSIITSDKRQVEFQDQPVQDTLAPSGAVDNPAIDVPPQPSARVSRPQGLNLSLPETAQDPASTPRPGRSSTIFDGQLLETLARQQERSGALEPSKLAIEGNASSFVGGRWQSFVKIGKLCFEVIEADPLDALSTDQWYRRDCD
ncbi:hypothetical protein [Congregibacter litoralis]|uniref:Uncharacterized protein n=1 Tax=Congregibacter litoralis KT71 TaxID=314285 RepID=A4A8C4_9GAMM|nr:hypothetical protein [Congregibacter litoralis]EAQ97919.1 hypothetical protein KT71_15179 [Congregibacter litoralis KT71]